MRISSDGYSEGWDEGRLPGPEEHDFEDDGLRRLKLVWVKTELAAEMYCDERVDKDGNSLYLDIPLSVSALERERDAR